MRPKGKKEPPKKTWRWKSIPPKELGKAAALGAIEQVTLSEDRPTVGMGSGAVFLSTNIRRNLGDLAERLEQAIKGRNDRTLMSDEFFTYLGRK